MLLNIAILTIIERKILARFQRRVGPYRIILQPIADGIKVLFKERVFRKG